MSGELWLQLFQLAKESSYGVAVPATRKVYGKGGLTRERVVHVIQTSTGTRDQNVDAHPRSVTAGGTFTQALSADELLEWLLISIQGGVTPTAVASTTPTTDPSLTVSGTDGTIAAGVITVSYTATTSAGESQPKVITSTATVTGAHEHIVVPSVAAGLPAGTTLVSYYVSTAGGGAATCTFSASNANGALINLALPGNGTQHPPAATPAPNYTWVFVPNPTLDSATVEWHDGSRNWQEAGVYVDQLKIIGNAGSGGDNTLEVTMFGKERIANAQTGSLTDRVPDFMEGWEAKLYIDPFGGTAGTTNVAGSLIDWTVTMTNGLGRKYTGDNTTATSRVVMGMLGATMDLTLEGNASALTEYNNWDAGTKRLVRLEFGNNVAIGTGTVKKKIMIDLPCAITVVDTSKEDAGTKSYGFQLTFVRDVVNAFPFRVTVLSTRSAAWV